MDVEDWLEAQTASGRPWFAKRLSANDTQATGSHQAGFHLPNLFVFRLFPDLREGRNPRLPLVLNVVSHGHAVPAAQLIYYNQLTRNECRITGLGGRRSAVLDPDNTGALTIAYFDVASESVEVWVGRNAAEEDVIERYVGEVEPAVARWAWLATGGKLEVFERAPTAGVVRQEHDHLPDNWLTRFPSPRELADAAIARVPARTGDLDGLLLARHRTEYALFKRVEEAHAGTTVHEGFDSVDSFLTTAQSLVQRRKSRAGTSLELQIAAILSWRGVRYERGATVDISHRPDFIFPSAYRYVEAETAAPDLHVLAVKSTLRDRWRQVLHEADKVPVKHLLTLDDGVSEGHISEMTSSGIRLVIPRPLQRGYPRSVRSQLMTFSEFVTSLGS